MAGTCNHVNLCLSPVGPGSSISVSLTAATVHPIPKATALHVNSATPPSGTGEGFSSATLLLDMTLTTSVGRKEKEKGAGQIEGGRAGGREGGIE